MGGYPTVVIKIQSRDIYAIMDGKLPVGGALVDKNTGHWLYNALDSAVTLRVWERLKPLVDAAPHASLTYSFERAMQGPALDMMNRGVAINTKVRQDETERYTALRNRAQTLLDRLANAVWGPETYEEVTKTRSLITPISPKTGKALKPRYVTTTHREARTRPLGLSANSPKQVLAFFNGALRFPVEWEVRKTPQGTIRTPTANDKALKKWAGFRTKGPGVDVRDRTVYPVRLAAPFVSLILSIRDADKMLSVLRSPLDSDGRMRCSYNVAATENWRWSSSKNVLGRGTNLQNITPSMRRMFCADDGYRMVSTDLEQAESYVVAGEVWRVTGDRTYLNAILSGDLHTQVVRMAWPEFSWTNDPKSNRAIANQSYPGLKYSYRDVAKRIGHGSNYDGSAYGISAKVGIPLNIVEDFQHRYFTAFPGIREWQRWVKAQIAEHQLLDTPHGQRRWFFGRPNEASTFREAIACVPQGTVGSLLNLIMHRCWERSKLPPSHPSHLPIEILLQNHDAFLFQTKLTHPLPSVIAAVNDEFKSAPIVFTRGGEQQAITIPGEFVTGFNWAYEDKDPDPGKWTFKDGNPDGLRKWGGEDNRRRKQNAASSPADWLGGPMPRVY
jgi:hypothetical protein